MSRFASSRSRARGSSPHDNDFHTATETFNNLDLIQSTPQRALSEDPLPLHYNEHPNVYDQDTQGSADMSVEMGRGVPRGGELEDVSSNAVFSFGPDNSLHEVGGTPPGRSRNAQHRPDAGLRKQAAVRRATESAALRSTNAGTKRVFSDSAARMTTSKPEEEPAQQATATFTVRGSRFAGVRQISSQYNIPKRFTADAGFESASHTSRRAAVGNTTVQSATYTAGQSFMLPDLPNITELVSGIRKDGTPVIKRTATSRSRFASNTQTHVPVGAAAIPEDEREILASIQELSNRVAQLEQEKNQAQRHLEEYEEQVIELRAQLDVATGRPDSGLGSEDETKDAPRLPQGERQRLQAKLKAGEERLQRSERKANVSDITVTRVTRERDHLITQLASAYYENEELEKENESFRDSYSSLKDENEDLSNQVRSLQEENAALRAELNQMSSTGRRAVSARRQRSVSRAESKPEGQVGQKQGSIAEDATGNNVASGKSAVNQQRVNAHEDIVTEVQRQVQKRRDAAVAEARRSQHIQRSASSWSLSKSRARAASHSEQNSRRTSAPADLEYSDVKLNTKSDLAHPSKRASKQAQQFEEDMTELSDLNEVDVANLRHKLEEELRAKHAQNQSRSHQDVTTHSSAQRPFTWKSSLKDVSAAVQDGTGRFSLAGTLDDIVQGTKTVRVQSPHTVDEISHTGDAATEVGDMSVLSNTGRRRRRADSAEGMTSAFIIPDITMHKTRTLSSSDHNRQIPHDPASCTACPHETTQVDIPIPVPASQRPGYVELTDATIRPSQAPALALATVIKNLEDEIKHLKIRRESQNRLYAQHDPALSKRRRMEVKNRIDALTAEIEKRSDQVYALYDVVEGTKQQDGTGKPMNEEGIEETLQSVGIDPAELSGRVGRKAPAALEDLSDESELQFEGFSDVASEENQEVRA